MRIKTTLHEDEIDLTLTTSELTWLQVLLHCLLMNDSIEGWKDDIRGLLGHLDALNPEGHRMKRTTEKFEKTDLEFMTLRGAIEATK